MNVKNGIIVEKVILVTLTGNDLEHYLPYEGKPTFSHISEL